MGAAVVEIIIKSTDQVTKGLKSIGKQATALGKTLTAGLTLPLVGIGIAATKMASDMDREMKNIQSISKATDPVIAALSRTFMDMSTDLTVTTDSAVKLAQGFYTIQGSGFAGADAMTVLEAATRAASAGLTDTEVAAKAITSALNAYGQGAEQAASFSDLMFRTVDIGVGTFEELSASLGYVVGTASQAGVGFDEVSAALSTMSKQGIEFNKGGRALNMLLLQLIKPTDELSAALLDVGYQSGQAALDALGLAGTLKALEAAGYGGTEGLADLGLSSMSLRAALALTGTGAEMFAGDLEAMQTASEGAGAAQEAFAIQTESFSAQMSNFKNIVQAAGIALGNELLPVLNDLLLQVVPLIQRFTELDPSILKIIIGVGALAAAAGPVLMVLGTLATVIGALLSPIGLVVVAVAALGLAWATNFGGIRDKTQAVFDFISPYIETAMTAIQTVIDTVLTTVAGWWEENHELIQGTADTVWEAIRSYIEIATTAIQNIIDTTLGTILGWWDENHELIQGTAETIWEAIQTFIDTTINFILNDIIIPVVTAIQTFWDEHGAAILLIAETIWGAIETFIDTTINAILGIIKAVMLLIQGDWEGAWEEIKGVGETIWEGIKTVVGDAINVVKDTVKIVLTELKSIWAGLWDDIQQTMTNYWKSIKTIAANKMGEVKDSIITKLNEAIAAITGMAGRFRDAGIAIIEGVIGGVHAKAHEMLKAVVQAIKDALAAAKAFLGVSCPDPSPVWAELGVGMAEGVGVGWAQGILNTQKAVVGGMKGLFGGGSSLAFAGGGGAAYSTPTAPARVAKPARTRGVETSKAARWDNVTVNVNTLEPAPVARQVERTLRRLSLQAELSAGRG